MSEYTTLSCYSWCPVCDKRIFVDCSVLIGSGMPPPPTMNKCPYCDARFEVEGDASVYIGEPE